MKKNILFGIAAISALVSCSKSETSTCPSLESFTADFADTKTTLNNDLSQSWVGGEYVRILDIAENNKFNSIPIENCHIFQNPSSSPSSTATFVSTDPNFHFELGHKYYVYYCGALDYLKKSGFYSETIAYPWIMYAVNQIFNPEKKYGISDDVIPLAGRIDASSSLSTKGNVSFSNVAALLVLRVTNQSSQPKTIHHITFSCLGEDGVIYKKFLFGNSYRSKSFDDQDFEMTPASSGFAKAKLTCNDFVLQAGATQDFGMVITPNSSSGKLIFEFYSASSESDATRIGLPVQTTGNVTKGTFLTGSVNVIKLNLWSDSETKSVAGIKTLDVEYETL